LCDGAAALGCAAGGSCRVLGACSGENPICVETAGRGAACVHEASTPCDPETFGTASDGQVCEEDRIVVCPATSRVTAVLTRCREGLHCVEPPSGGDPFCVAEVAGPEAAPDESVVEPAVGEQGSAPAPEGNGQEG
jgi:hypothetical protein